MCSCVQIATVEWSVSGGGNPLGGGKSECFQVSSQVLFSGISVDSEKILIYVKHNHCLIYLLETTMETLVSSWESGINANRNVKNREELLTDLRKEIEEILLHEKKVNSKGVETKFQRTNDITEEVIDIS